MNELYDGIEQGSISNRTEMSQSVIWTGMNRMTLMTEFLCKEDNATLG